MSGRASLDLLRPDPVTFPRGVADQELRGITNFGSNTPFSVARHFWKCVIKTRAAGWPSCNSAALSFARKSKRLVVIFGLGRFPKQPSPKSFFSFFFYFLYSIFSRLLLDNNNVAIVKKRKKTKKRKKRKIWGEGCFGERPNPKITTSLFDFLANGSAALLA